MATAPPKEWPAQAATTGVRKPQMLTTRQIDDPAKWEDYRTIAAFCFAVVHGPTAARLGLSQLEPEILCELLDDSVHNFTL